MKVVINNRGKNVLILFIVALVVGYILSYQFNLQKKINKISENNEDASLAIEVASLINSNEALAKQSADLSEQKDKLSSSSSAASEAAKNLDNDISKYKIISGKTDVHGSGIIITINEPLLQAQLVDTVNALRNIGYDAMSINDRRILTNSSFNGSLSPTITIKVIGDANLLKEGMERSGGILEQTNIKADIRIDKNITIKAINN